jgi:amino acid transporter
MEWELASVAALIIFILVIASVLLLVLKPTSIPLGRGRRLALPFWICPPLGVALMLCFTSMTWADVGR